VYPQAKKGGKRQWIFVRHLQICKLEHYFGKGKRFFVSKDSFLGYSGAHHRTPIN
jgi:hypothetical protein